MQEVICDSRGGQLPRCCGEYGMRVIGIAYSGDTFLLTLVCFGCYQFIEIGLTERFRAR